MRKLIQLVLTIALLSGASALAQGGMYAGGGVNVGYVGGACVAGNCVGGVAFGVKGQFGMRDVLSQDLGVRADIGINFTSGLTFFRFGADAIYEIDAGDMALAPYVGGGLRLGYATVSVTSGGFSASAGGFIAGAGILGGATLPVSEDLNAFGELNLDLSSLGFVPSLAVGVNFDL